MSKVYDLLVVGAGPAGLMAAKTAGENGLRVALLERKANRRKLKGPAWKRFLPPMNLAWENI